MYINFDEESDTYLTLENSSRRVTIYVNYSSFERVFIPFRSRERNIRLKSCIDRGRFLEFQTGHSFSVGISSE